MKAAGRLEDISVKETRTVLDGNIDGAELQSVAKKLKEYHPANSEEYFTIFKRNLEGLIHQD